MRGLKGVSTPAVMGLAGLLGAAAYAWLAVCSWDRVEVNLQVFFLALGLAWGATLGLYVRQRQAPKHLPLLPMLVWGLLFRVIGLLGNPLLEDDYYRYLWDGRTFAVSGNPYADRPYDHFTDTDLPAAFQHILDNVNHPHIPTIYGPVCQYAFLMSYWLAPGQLFPLKLLFVLADMLTLWLLLRLAKPLPVLLYAWCPLLIKETAFTAHPDTLGVLFLVAALYAHTRVRHGLTAILLGFAVGTKILAALLVPFLLRPAKATDWLLFGGTLLLVYLPFWAQGSFGAVAGMSIFLHDWEFNSSLYGLLALWLGSRSARLIGMGLWGAFCLGYLWTYRHQAPSAIPRGDWLYGVLFLLSPILNPWYLLWLLPFVVLFPSAWGVTALVAVSLSYAHGLYIDTATLPPYGHPAWVRPLEFAAIALAGVYDLWRYWRNASKRQNKEGP